MAEHCGCKIVYGHKLHDDGSLTDTVTTSYCPLHAAAPLTLAACKTALYYIDLTGDGVSSAEQNAKVALRAAIAAAEPVTEVK